MEGNTEVPGGEAEQKMRLKIILEFETDGCHLAFAENDVCVPVTRCSNLDPC